ncbi:hypothetical protein A6C57_00295 [Fibrella sp. ES10-3-2-2]|nr:hypothetical protein A6C57_00295 [Fibrella sp. ES10-3-2-2]
MLNVTKTSVDRGVPLYQSMFETAQGGFTLDKTGLDPNLKLLPGGTLLGYDESTRKASVIKGATLTAPAGATDTTYQVKKGHTLKVGDILGATLKSKAYAITTIVTTDPAFDAVTLNTTLGAALTAGTSLFQAKSEGATVAAFVTTPKGLLYEDTVLEGNVDVAVVVRGTVYARRIPGVAADVQAALPLIIFSQSY